MSPPDPSYMSTASGIASSRAVSSVRRAARRRHSDTPALKGGTSTRIIAARCTSSMPAVSALTGSAYLSSTRTIASEFVVSPAPSRQRAANCEAALTLCLSGQVDRLTATYVIGVRLVFHRSNADCVGTMKTSLTPITYFLSLALLHDRSYRLV